MTTRTITFDPNLFIAGGTGPTPLTVTAKPYRPSGWPIPLDGDEFGVKNEVEKYITPADPTLELEETGVDWCWKFEVRHRSVDTQWVKYAFLTTDINFLDMAALDPHTFDPEPPPDPAWLAGLNAEIAARIAADAALQAQINGIEASDIETVAGVGPTGGDVPVASLRTALNLPADTAADLSVLDTRLDAVEATGVSLQAQIDAIVAAITANLARAVSTDGSYGLPLPTGVGFEWIYTANQLDDVQMDGNPS